MIVLFKRNTGKINHMGDGNYTLSTIARLPVHAYIRTF
jgi:hypothetical protein